MNRSLTAEVREITLSAALSLAWRGMWSDNGLFTVFKYSYIVRKWKNTLNQRRSQNKREHVGLCDQGANKGFTNQTVKHGLHRLWWEVVQELPARFVSSLTWNKSLIIGRKTKQIYRQMVEKQTTGADVQMDQCASGQSSQVNEDRRRRPRRKEVRVEVRTSSELRVETHVEGKTSSGRVAGQTWDSGLEAGDPGQMAQRWDMLTETLTGTSKKQQTDEAGSMGGWWWRWSPWEPGAGTSVMTLVSRGKWAGTRWRTGLHQGGTDRVSPGTRPTRGPAPESGWVSPGLLGIGGSGSLSSWSSVSFHSWQLWSLIPSGKEFFSHGCEGGSLHVCRSQEQPPPLLHSPWGRTTFPKVHLQRKSLFLIRSWSHNELMEAEGGARLLRLGAKS